MIKHHGQCCQRNSRGKIMPRNVSNKKRKKNRNTKPNKKLETAEPEEKPLKNSFLEDYVKIVLQRSVLEVAILILLLQNEVRIMSNWKSVFTFFMGGSTSRSAVAQDQSAQGD